jgi:hypothetical protein
MGTLYPGARGFIPEQVIDSALESITLGRRCLRDGLERSLHLSARRGSCLTFATW